MATSPKSKPMSFDVIDAAEVKVAPRGRKAVLDADLTAAFENLPIGKAINLAPKFGAVEGSDRPKVSQTIRKNWKSVRSDDCRIDFGTDGIPHVQVKVAKAAAKSAS